MEPSDLPEIPGDPELVARMALELLREKGALEVPCSACGASDRWTVEERQALVTHLREDGSVAYDAEKGEWAGIAVVYCWCQSCGFIRMHHLQGLFRD